MDSEEANSIAGKEWSIRPKVNVTNAVRKVLLNAAKEGLFPREIRIALAEEGIHSSAQVIANALCRLKRRDYTIERDGRHYLKIFEQFMEPIETANPA